MCVFDEQTGAAIAPLGRDKVRFAGSFKVSDWERTMDTPAAMARARRLAARVEELLPGVADLAVAELRVGLRPSTPSGRPLIGRVPGVPRLWINGGHGTHGWTLAPGSALAMASLLRGDSPDVGFEFLTKKD